MSEFIQLHILTSYPVSNLNRDDLGSPKNAIMGGKRRLRISSQCLKRAWRTSDIFEQQLAGHLGTRTKRIGDQVYHQLRNANVKEAQALEWAEKIAGVFGKIKKAEDKKNAASAEDENKKERLRAESETMVHFSTDELAAINTLVEKLIQSGKGPEDSDLKLLAQNRNAADIALFGRMLAATPDFNADAALQVAHAITVHEAAIETDYFSAVDDLNRGSEDRGSGHIGEAEFGAGVFYLYACLNRDLLVKNLNGNVELANRAIDALVRASATVAPSGKQNSFGSRAYASYVLVERGSRQPRSLSVAFLKPVEGKKDGQLLEAISSLEATRNNIDACYGPVADSFYVLNSADGKGTLEAAVAFATGGSV